MLPLLTPILTVLLILSVAGLLYIFGVALGDWHARQKLKRENIGRGRTKEGVAPLENAIANKTKARLWGFSFADVGLFFSNIALVMVTALTLTTTVIENGVLNRPYIAVDTTELAKLETGQVKSNLEDYSNQLIQKNLEFTIANMGRTPATFSIDLSEFREVGVVQIIPQENSVGVIFPGESKKVHYLLEIRSHFPPTVEEINEHEQYLVRMKALRDGKDEYMSRIAIRYDYLGQNDQERFRTLIDQKLPKTGFSENEAARIDGYSFVWVTSSATK